MKLKIKIKHKVILLFTVFTFLLLSAILIYFYYSNLAYIEEQSKIKSDFYSSLFIETFNKEIFNTQLEIEGLRNQLKNYISKAGEPTKIQIDFSKTLNTYLLVYPYKFREIIINKAGWNKALKVYPTRLFSGEIVISENSIDTTELNELKLNLIKGVSKEAGNIKKILNDDLILYFPPVKDNTLELFCIPHLNYLIEQSILKINFPATVSLSLVNKDSIIVFSTIIRNTNQHINIVLPSVGFPSKASGFEGIQNSFSINDNIIEWRYLNEMNYYILIQDYYGNEINKLNSTALRIFIFAILLLAAVIFITIYFSNRLSHTLEQITGIANTVAEGDFSKKIKLKRNDEIGILIDSFNDMIEKLDLNYKELNHLNKQLENKIQELIQTKTELSQKQRLALVGETISKISHEIQNKISGISIWVQNLEYQSKNDETAKIYLHEIKEALKSFQEKLVNFKKFYRQPQLNKQRIELNPFINNILNKYSLEISAKNLVIKKIYGKDIPLLCGDSEQLEEAFVNLLINALFYSPEKGTIEICTGFSDNVIRFSISDEGPGIKQEDLEKILQPFYTTKSSGSGLGLAIANNIISAHNGKLNYLNKENGGACFVVVLQITESGEVNESSFS